MLYLALLLTIGYVGYLVWEKRTNDKRLASFLLEEFHRTGNPEIRMTQEQIAQNTNSAREVVARMLKRFSEQGLVHMKRGSIRIPDPDALRKRI